MAGVFALGTSRPLAGGPVLNMGRGRGVNCVLHTV